MQDPPSFDSIRLGQWVQTADHQSIEEFASPRQIASPALFTCLMGDGKTTDIPRLLKLSNWQWLPKAHPLAFLAPIDRLLVLERLLQMPEGIVFLGDSLAAEQFSALHAILEGSDPPNALYVRIKQQTTKANGVLMVLQSVLLLHPAGPLYAKLLAEGQHGEKRLQPPVAHLLRCHFLLPDFAEVASLADGNNVTLPLYTWGSDVDYVSVVNSIGEAYDGPSGPELAKTLVVFNTAAHWNPIKLHGMRPDVPAADNVLGAYRRMTTIFLERFRAMPHFDRLQLVYRSSHFVPLLCDRSWTVPLLPSDDIQIGTKYYYDNFDRLDAVWRERLADVPGASYYDVRETSKLRPDARRDPPNDCLHLASPVAQEIQLVMWRVLLAS